MKKTREKYGKCTYVHIYNGIIFASFANKFKYAHFPLHICTSFPCLSLMRQNMKMR